MNHNQILKEMKECIGTRDPVVYFDKLTDCLSVLFNKIDELEKQNHKIKMLAALAVQWDPAVASNLLAEQIKELRVNKDIFENEIELFKSAYGQDKVTQNCTDFCNFWKDTLGWHPFTGA